jgi:hypothetical protein
MDAGSIKPRQVGFSPAIGRSLLARLSSKWILLGHLFLAKDCWMRRQHAIRVVFRFGGYETGPYLGWGDGDRREVSLTLKVSVIISQTTLVKQISENVPSVPEFQCAIVGQFPVTRQIRS